MNAPVWQRWWTPFRFWTPATFDDMAKALKWAQERELLILHLTQAQLDRMNDALLDVQTRVDALELWREEEQSVLRRVDDDLK